MSGPAHGNRNRATHRAVVDLVGAYFEHENIPATVYRAPGKLSETMGDDSLVPDISIPGVAVTVTSRLRHRLSDDVDSATRTAVLNGESVGALVQWRAERPISESYAILPLSDLVKLVRSAVAASP